MRSYKIKKKRMKEKTSNSTPTFHNLSLIYTNFFNPARARCLITYTHSASKSKMSEVKELSGLV